MEDLDNVKEKIGSENYRLLIDDIKFGKIKKEKVKKIGLRMHKMVNGIFENNLNLDLHETMDRMLQMWYTEVLHESNDGEELLLNILEDVDIGLKELASRMKKAKMGSGLPKIHPEEPGWLRENKTENDTASLAFVSKQMGEVCASHAVGKAVLELLHDSGFDADQNEIIEALRKEVQPDNMAKNPDKFNGKTITVLTSKQNNKEKKASQHLEVRVLTQWGDVDHTNQTYKTVQIADKKMKMKRVLRWDVGIAIDDKRHYGPHAIYSTNYNMTTGIYSCINSWGDGFFLGTPDIHHSKIYAVDYISIIEAN